VVRLRLPADGLHGDVSLGRAQDRGRAPGAHSPRPGALSLEKLVVKALKHTTWLVIALWTGYTFVGYFTPIRDLGIRAITWNLGPWETFWVLFYGFATYGNAGFMREQVCKYMCPYARFQSAMFDRDTLIIAYDTERGEPRGPRSRKADPGAAGLGHCVDCNICVQVCPTGIDIRKGLQYECIGCAACIDGCNQVMGRMGYPEGLIRYASENALEQHLDAGAMWRRMLRPRTLIYTGLLLAIIAATGASLYLRNPLKVDIIRDRGALAREAAPGLIENVYRLQIMKHREKPRRFTIAATGLPGLKVMGVAQPVEVGAAAALLLPFELQYAADADDDDDHKRDREQHDDGRRSPARTRSRSWSRPSTTRRSSAASDRASSCRAERGSRHHDGNPRADIDRLRQALVPGTLPWLLMAGPRSWWSPPSPRRISRYRRTTGSSPTTITSAAWSSTACSSASSAAPRWGWARRRDRRRRRGAGGVARERRRPGSGRADAEAQPCHARGIGSPRDASARHRGAYIGLMEPPPAGRWLVILETEAWRLPTAEVAGRPERVRLGSERSPQ